MSSDKIRDLRSRLGWTQGQLAGLIGVHPITVSKWERGEARPTPHQQGLLDAFDRASRRKPDVGTAVVGLLVGAGVGVALYHLLKAAFGDESQGKDASSHGRSRRPSA